MNDFIKIRKHEITSAYLYLDSRRYTDLVINKAEIASAGFDSEYPNGYGEVLQHLTLKLTSGDKIELYREDAKAAWEKLNEDKDEKLLKAIKDYAAHGHKDSTPFDIALCIEQAIDNAENNKWHTPEEEPVPSGKYAEEDFPQIPCLVQFKYNDYGVRYWNVTYKCWNDEDCDDYYCNMDKVKRWAYIREE